MRRDGETSERALARCYPKLLASREAEYKKLAHVTISYYRHRAALFQVQDFLRDAGIGRIKQCNDRSPAGSGAWACV